MGDLGGRTATFCMLATTSGALPEKGKKCGLQWFLYTAARVG